MSAGPGRKTIGAVRRDVAKRFVEVGIETAQLDARVLVAFALGVAANDLPLHESEPFPAHLAEFLDGLVDRRLAAEPVARIVGRKEFWSLDLELSPDTLVPRPDTETLVSAALTRFAVRSGEPLRLLDIGTGSGAILLALLSELPSAYGVGTDLAPGAAGAARRNAERLGLGSRSAFVVCNWADAIAGRFDGILSNPPYIAGDDIRGLPAEVRDYDPLRALDGGKDGFDGHRAVLEAANRLLDATGSVFIEVGFDQGAGLKALSERSGWKASGHSDLGGITRVIALSRV